MENSEIYHVEPDPNQNKMIRPQDHPSAIQPDYRVCGICGRENQPDEDHWPAIDLCPNCQADEQEIARLAPNDTTPTKRHPVPIAALPTKDRLTLQCLLQLATELIIRFHPSEQVGWLNYLLEQLDVQNLAKYNRFTHAENTLRALRREISARLDTGCW